MSMEIMPNQYQYLCPMAWILVWEMAERNDPLYRTFLRRMIHIAIFGSPSGLIRARMGMRRIRMNTPPLLDCELPGGKKLSDCCWPESGK